jgi:ATP-dependent RNA helicase DeaD
MHARLVERGFSAVALSGELTQNERTHALQALRDGREMVWFEVDIGRARNADPRWLLPLICRAGNVTKSEIGAIRIHENGSRFEVAAEFADRFAEAARTMKSNEARISRAGAAAPEAGTNGASRSAPASEPAPSGEPRRKFGKFRERHGKDDSRPSFRTKPSWSDHKSRDRSAGDLKPGDRKREDRKPSDRKSANGNGQPHRRNGDDAGRPFAKPRPHGSGAKPHGKPVSKYAHKKKRREPTTDA